MSKSPCPADFNPPSPALTYILVSAVHVWDACQGNKLYAIYPNVGGYQYQSSLSRRDAVLVNRLRIGHTRLTHSYQLSGDDQPVCSACQFPLTVKQFLIECVNFAAICSSYFSASSMKDTKVSVDYTQMGHSWRTGWLVQL